MTPAVISRIAAAAVSVTLLAPTAGFAEGGAFDGLPGYWNGGGQVTLGDGSNERIRCKASYAVPSNPHLMQLHLVCASDSYRFDITSNVEERGGRLSGSWSEATRNVNGEVSGSASRGRINAQVAAPGFNAALAVTTRGASQSVAITPQGNTDVRGVSVTLRKR